MNDRSKCYPTDLNSLLEKGDRRGARKLPTMKDFDAALCRLHRSAYMDGQDERAETNSDEDAENVYRIAQQWHDAAKANAKDTERYRELIYQVQAKIPGESRHETALRIIQQHENQPNPPLKAKENNDG